MKSAHVPSWSEESGVRDPSLPIHLNKVCEAEDFLNSELLDAMRRVYSHDVQASGASWPRGAEQRKMWEVAMAIVAMERCAAINQESMVLGVGAGIEFTIFYLTNHVRWVFATDLYATPTAEWETAAPPTMLTDPASLSPFPCNPRRLVVQHMDGRQLAYEDATFDAVFSSSSIEHFGDWEDVMLSAREMGRVLKPGGVLSLSTEYRIRGDGRGVPGVLMFSPDEFRSLIIEPSGLEPIDEPDFAISERTLSRVVMQAEMDRFYQALAQGLPTRWETIPHIILDNGQYTWTSCHLALRKPN